MFDIHQMARPSIARRKPYTPNKPPDERMKALGLSDYVDLATNQNPAQLSSQVYEVILQEARRVNIYPESTCYALKKALSDQFGLDSEQFFIDNGLDAVITQIGLTFIDPMDEVLIQPPTFPAYENITQKMGGTVVKVPLDDSYRIQSEAILSAITSRTKIVFLCNPNNPTGMVLSRTEFESLLTHIPQNILVVSDEAFYEFVDDPLYPQTLDYLPAHPNLIILRSFSKTLALAGLRVGYAMASLDVIQMMMRSREPFPVNCIAQAAAVAVLSDQEFVSATLKQNRQLKEKFSAALNLLGLKVYPSQTNFVMVELPTAARPIWQAMFDRGVVVRLLEEMGVPNGLRICIGKESDLQRAVMVIADVLGKQAPPW